MKGTYLLGTEKVTWKFFTNRDDKKYFTHCFHITMLTRYVLELSSVVMFYVHFL